MKKKVLLGALGLSALSAALVTLTQAPEAEANGVYYMSCRAPFNLQLRKSAAGTELTVTPSVGKHAAAAGEKGASLAVGTCAWKDRAMGSNESNMIVFSSANPTPIQNWVISTVTACATSSKCVLEVPVAKVSGRVEFMAHSFDQGSVWTYNRP